MAKIGRPIVWPDANTPLAIRLQEILPRESFADLSQKYFSKAARETVSKFLSGENEPTATALVTISEKTGCDLEWLLTGKEQGKKAPLQAISTEVNLERMRELRQMMYEVQMYLDDHYIDALTGKIPEKRFAALLKAAMEGMKEYEKAQNTLDKQQSTAG